MKDLRRSERLKRQLSKLKISVSSKSVRKRRRKLQRRLPKTSRSSPTSLVVELVEAKLRVALHQSSSSLRLQI